MSGKGAGGFCSSDLLCFVFLSTDTNKEGTENISAGNAYCLWSKVSTDQNYEKNCRKQDGVEHIELVFQNSTSVTLSSSQAGPQKWLQLALLRGITSGSSRQSWPLLPLNIWKPKLEAFFKMLSEVQCQLHTLLLAERTQEQASVLFWDRIQRQIRSSSFCSNMQRIFQRHNCLLSPSFPHLFSKSGTPNQLFQRKQRPDFTDSFLLLHLPTAAISVIISIAVIPSATQNSHPPKNTPLQIHLLSWLNKLQLHNLFFSWDFLNQISVSLLASTGMICNFTCHSSD